MGIPIGLPGHLFPCHGACVPPTQQFWCASLESVTGIGQLCPVDSSNTCVTGSVTSRLECEAANTAAEYNRSSHQILAGELHTWGPQIKRLGRGVCVCEKSTCKDLWHISLYVV